MMDTISDFLEGSTIHGLTYISTSKPRIVKVVWTILVITAFLIAGLLITKSYKAWQETPISSSITTYPISFINFPTITVCPPQDSNTAINEDLLRLGKIPYDEKQREFLTNKAKTIFIEQAIINYADTIIETSNI